MAAADWGSARLEDLSRHVSALTERYDSMAQRLARLDERDMTATQERADIRQGMKDITVEMRMVLQQIDQSCSEKVENIGRRMDASSKDIMTAVREEIRTQISLRLAEYEDKRRWSPKETAAIYAAAVASAGALLAAVLK